MTEFINKEFKDIKLKLNFIIKQNYDIQNSLEKISTALLVNSENHNKAIEEFLDEFLKRDN